MKEIDEAIEGIEERIAYLRALGISEEHSELSPNKTALSALKTIENIRELIREAKKKWYNDLTYQERDLYTIDDFTAEFIMDKFHSYQTGGE